MTFCYDLSIFRAKKRILCIIAASTKSQKLLMFRAGILLVLGGIVFGGYAYNEICFKLLIEGMFPYKFFCQVTGIFLIWTFV